ncbi:uncharacterized protein LOC130641216 [Hydractinia symbiolongicarpus]|uniref:uncharacterized protein LOC130641216 n=1 Tax=Hydractinia symbiolongicarpus TaxID=13093 RepID=UPI002550945A|nr:uncharacterized protein LOC130641216 [Hydractinia symbiolongicarpus]
MERISSSWRNMCLLKQNHEIWVRFPIKKNGEAYTVYFPPFNFGDGYLLAVEATIVSEKFYIYLKRLPWNFDQFLPPFVKRVTFIIELPERMEIDSFSSDLTPIGKRSRIGTGRKVKLPYEEPFIYVKIGLDEPYEDIQH